MSDNGMINITNDEFSGLLKTLVQFGIRTEPLLESVGRSFKTRVLNQFRSGTDPYGQSWKQTQRGGQILVDKEGLIRSFVVKVSGNEVQLGTSKVYARVLSLGLVKTVQVKAHQRKVTQAFGHRLPYPILSQVSAHSRRMRMPARPILPNERGLPVSWEKGVRRLVLNHLNRIEQGKVK